MLTAMIAEQPMDIVDDQEVKKARDLGHFEDSPNDLEKVAGLIVGIPELFKRHLPAVVGRAEAKSDGGHVRVELGRRSF